MYAQIHHISILNRLIKPTFDFYHNTIVDELRKEVSTCYLRKKFYTY